MKDELLLTRSNRCCKGCLSCSRWHSLQSNHLRPKRDDEPCRRVWLRRQTTWRADWYLSVEDMFTENTISNHWYATQNLDVLPHSEVCQLMSYQRTSTEIRNVLPQYSFTSVPRLSFYQDVLHAIGAPGRAGVGYPQPLASTIY
jgi:hypothetical protein